jgi:uncharacterized protein DUF6174
LTYVITVDPECECLPGMTGPVKVTVQNGLVVSRQYVGSGAAVSSQYASAFPSVDGLFALIDATVQKATQPVSAQYDGAIGYPTQLTIGDPTRDAGITYSMSAFRIP